MVKKNGKGRVWTAEEKAEAKRKYWERMNPEKLKQMDIEQELAEARQVEEETEKDDQDPQTTTVVDTAETSNEELMKRAIEAVEFLKSMGMGGAVAAPAGPTIQNGKLTGTLDRFPVDANLYVDFTDRLSDDPSLARFGFKENYWLDYRFEVVRYQTIDNIWQQEPKITIDLNRREFNEETGLPTGGAFKMYRIVIHEDPDTAVYIARLNGIAVPEDPAGEMAFLNEMRFLQVRDWLRECFMPKKPSGHNDKREMVINGRLVEYFEVNSENAQTLPFGELNSKV